MLISNCRRINEHSLSVDYCQVKLQKNVSNWTSTWLKNISNAQGIGSNNSITFFIKAIRPQKPIAYFHQNDSNNIDKFIHPLDLLLIHINYLFGVWITVAIYQTEARRKQQKVCKIIGEAACDFIWVMYQTQNKGGKITTVNSIRGLNHYHMNLKQASESNDYYLHIGLDLRGVKVHFAEKQFLLAQQWSTKYVSVEERRKI